MNKHIKLFITAAALLAGVAASADEGMWMVQSISSELQKAMQTKGLKLSADELYNVNGTSLKDAIVSMEFIGTGSFISDKGLIITNHHVAFSDIFSISTSGNNYLEKGFWAQSMEEEIPLKGKTILLLDHIQEVTDEVLALIEKETKEGKVPGSRRLSHLMEKKYEKTSGMTCSLDAMWAGSRYFLSFYRKYNDVRLVAAPPVRIASFGGDTDNWEWPQHKCDFAMYRVYCAPDGKAAKYSKDNVPYHPSRWLKISDKPLKKGDFTMVLGYPGRTDRYTSAAKLKYRLEVELPALNEVRGENMRIIQKWMNEDPEIRLKYSDRFFNLSNVQELYCGEEEYFKRYGCIEEKMKEAEILEGEENRELIKKLEDTYQSFRKAKLNSLYYREALLRSSQLGILAMKMHNRSKDLKTDKFYDGIDLRVEKDIMFYGIRLFYTKVDQSAWGPYQSELFREFNGDLDGICKHVWEDCKLTPESRLVKFINDVQVRDLSRAVDEAEGGESVAKLNRRYTNALYKAREKAGILQYPDANSTMRLTYGTVQSFRRNGKMLPWQTFSNEILAKEDSTNYDFTLDRDWKELLASAKPFGVNFVNDCDITGGNSGSPVLNAQGELVGLAFDGNKESLASDVSFTPEFNRTVCVDIRYILWVLKNYARMDGILKEITP